MLDEAVAPVVIVTFFTTTGFVGGPSPLDGARDPMDFATSSPFVMLPITA